MSKAMTFAAYLCVSVALVSAGEFSAEWNEWKTLHGKIYESEREELTRYATWVANKAYIEEHNKHSDVHGFTLKMNQFGDLGSKEFAQLYTRRLSDRDINGNIDAPMYVPTNASIPPASIDYRVLGYVTPVKNQGECFSCWSFAATGALEGQHFKKNKKLISLSEQNLIDCDTDYNQGCDRGLENLAFNYVKQKGIQSEETYPYLGYDSQCKADPDKVVVRCTGYVRVQSGDENALVNAIATIGPIATGFDGSDPNFKYYGGGVYSGSENCGKTKDDLMHSMLIVGYKTIDNKPVYIVKNSEGTGWGDNGYIYVLRGQNTCGIATEASYPTM
ncbi:procathepsin L-like [Dysidea avara]|uniref:procathepsin L-like n=1 Tax=Dysidea avara TaxID=196820 RepID=UPI00331C1401